MEHFRPMRRIRQQLSHEDAEQILQHSTSGVLSVNGDEGYPYAVPVSYVYADGKIYFHSALQGHKVDAIRNNPKVSFCVIAQDDVKPMEFTTYFKKRDSLWKREDNRRRGRTDENTPSTGEALFRRNRHGGNDGQRDCTRFQTSSYD